MTRVTKEEVRPGGRKPGIRKWGVLTSACLDPRSPYWSPQVEMRPGPSQEGATSGLEATPEHPSPKKEMPKSATSPYGPQFPQLNDGSALPRSLEAPGRLPSGPQRSFPVTSSRSPLVSVQLQKPQSHSHPSTGPRSVVRETRRERGGLRGSLAQGREASPVSSQGSGFWFRLPPLDLVFLPPSLFLALVIYKIGK